MITQSSATNVNGTIVAVSPQMLEPRWYAAYTRSRHEKRIAEQLSRQGVESFVPLWETVRSWKNGRHRVQLPLFSGYVFVRASLRDRLRVLRVPGVVRLVGFSGMPVALPDEEIEHLRHALANGTKAEPHPYLRVGERVRIIGGPFRGYVGILMRRQGDPRVVISIQLIQRSILIDVESKLLEPDYRQLPVGGGLGATKFADRRYS